MHGGVVVCGSAALIPRGGWGEKGWMVEGPRR